MATGAVDLAARAVARAREPGPRTVPARPVQLPGNGRVPALDGLRALAVLAVLAFHGGCPGHAAGSSVSTRSSCCPGYLITSLLLAEWQRDRTHRHARVLGPAARRLLPALLLLVLTVALTARYLVPVEEQSAAAEATGWLRCSTWRTGGWCSAAATTSRTRPARHRSSTRGPSGSRSSSTCCVRSCSALVLVVSRRPLRALGALVAAWGRRVVVSPLAAAVRPVRPGADATTAPTPGPAACWSGSRSPSPCQPSRRVRGDRRLWASRRVVRLGVGCGRRRRCGVPRLGLDPRGRD